MQMKINGVLGLACFVLFFGNRTLLNNVERDYQTYRLCKSRLLKFKFIVIAAFLHHACETILSLCKGERDLKRKGKRLKQD